VSLKKWNEQKILPNVKPEPSQNAKLEPKKEWRPIQYAEPDMVNHPSHYTRGKVEAIDALESAVTGLEGKEAGLTWQVIKYMWRWKFKGQPLRDLQKARFYLERLIKSLEGDN
jgi:hypothetical protein